MESDLQPKVRLTDNVLYLINKHLDKLIKEKTQDVITQREKPQSLTGNHRHNLDEDTRLDISLPVIIFRPSSYLTEVEKAVMNRKRHAPLALEVNNELMETLIRPRVNHNLQWQNVELLCRSMMNFLKNYKWPRVPTIPFLQLPEDLLEDGLLLDLTVNRKGKKLLVVERLLRCVQEWVITGSPPKRVPLQAEWKATLQGREYNGRSVLYVLWLSVYLLPQVTEFQTGRISIVHSCIDYLHINQDGMIRMSLLRRPRFRRATPVWQFLL